MPGVRDSATRAQAVDFTSGKSKLLQHIFIVLADIWCASCRDLRNAVHLQRATHRKLHVLAGPLQRHDDVVLSQLWIVGGLSWRLHNSVRKSCLRQLLSPVFERLAGEGLIEDLRQFRGVRRPLLSVREPRIDRKLDEIDRRLAN